MYDNLLWFDDPCGCGLCLQLRTSFVNAYEAVRSADKRLASFPTIVNAASAVGEAAQQLHREHRPELYVDWQNLAIASSNGTEVCRIHELSRVFANYLQAGSTSPSTSPQRAGHTPKQVMVCDHCMAHGLVCNEASVCEQCRSYGQPCIHRWCSQSPTSKDDCNNPRCHYAHMDAIPHAEKEPKWVIFKGDLPHHLLRGRLPSLAMAGAPPDVSSEQWMKILNERQQDGVRIFAGAVKAKTAAYAGYYIQCCCNAT
jgi:hypothetical protein